MEVNILKALDMARFPKAYKEYFALEEELVRRTARGDVLDVGCGTGRIIPALSGVCSSYTGIDREQALLNKARLQVKNAGFPVRFVACDANYLDRTFIEGQFDTSLCLWNTLPLIGNERDILARMANVTKKNGLVLVTLAAKNESTFRTRLNYYKLTGFNCTFDTNTQTIYSDVWGESKAYEQTELDNLSVTTKVPLIEKGDLGLLGIYGIFSGGKR